MTFNKTAMPHITKSFHHRGHVEDLPEWAKLFHLHYFQIRTEGRDAAKRRRCYRRVEEIKLQLVERGIDYELICAVTFFLATYRVTAATEVSRLLANPSPQMSFNFFNN